MRERIDAWWVYLQDHPRAKNQVYWGGLCVLGALTCLALAGILEETRGNAMGVAFLSRMLSGPAWAIWQAGLQIDWNLWEANMVYSLIQWIVVWIPGALVLRRLPAIPPRRLMEVAVGAVCLIGLILADTPRDQFPIPLFE